MKAKKIDDIRINTFIDESRWIDYQDVFTKRFELERQISLEEALGRVEIEPEGRFHDGLDDAVNTGRLIEKLELNLEYQLVSYEMPEKETEHLSCTLGELLSGLNLQLVLKMEMFGTLQNSQIVQFPTSCFAKRSTICFPPMIYWSYRLVRGEGIGAERK